MSEFPLDEAYAFLREHGLSAEANTIRTGHERSEGVSALQLKKAKVLHYVEERGLLDQFIDEIYPEGGYGPGRARLSRLRTTYTRYESGALVAVQERVDGEVGERIRAQLSNAVGPPVGALTVKNKLHIWWNKFADGDHAGETTRDAILGGKSPPVEARGCLFSIVGAIELVTIGFLLWFAMGDADDRDAARATLTLLAFVLGAGAFVGYFGFFREPTPPPFDLRQHVRPTERVLVREYSDREAYENDARQLAGYGYAIRSVVDQQQRSGAVRIATLGFGALLWKPKPRLVVTYERAS